MQQSRTTRPPIRDTDRTTGRIEAPSIRKVIPDAEEDDDFQDRLYEVLSNRRRRFVLGYLETVERPATFREMVERVAAWETGKHTEDVTSEERKRVYTALRQFHLPKMEDAGVIEYDKERGVIDLSERVSEAQLIETDRDTENIRSGVYLVAMIASLGVGVAVWQSLALSDSLSPLAWAVTIGAVVAVSVLGYRYGTGTASRRILGS